MTIDELIALLTNRLAFIASQRATAVLRGDVTMVAALDEDAAVTAATLSAITPPAPSED